MQPSDKTSEAGRHRRLVSQVLVAGLIAVAYSEPVGPATEAFDKHGVDIRSTAWLLIYVATVLRFFIGNIVHLESPDLAGREAVFRWFFDISFVIAECIVLIFAGAVTSLHSSAIAHVSFTDYLMALYILDVTWLGSMQLLSAVGKSRHPGIFRSMARNDDMAPFQWAIVNIILGLIMWLWLGLLGHPADIPEWKLWVLLVANILVFFYDLFKIAYGIRDAPITPSAPSRS